MKEDSLEEAYIKYYQVLFLYAFSLTKNKEDSEDLVENTFVKAFLSFEKGNLKAWLYIVLRNEFYNMYRKQKRFMSIDKVGIERVQDSLDVLKSKYHLDQSFIDTWFKDISLSDGNIDSLYCVEIPVCACSNFSCSFFSSSIVTSFP